MKRKAKDKVVWRELESMKMELPQAADQRTPINLKEWIRSLEIKISFQYPHQLKAQVFT